MYVCMYVRMYVFMRTECTGMYVCLYVYISLYVLYVCMYVCMYVCISLYVSIQSPTMVRSENEISKCEFILLVLTLMGKVEERDIFLVEKLFENWDTNLDGMK